MNILVIGSEGNIGSRLVPHLKDVGYSVHRADILQGSEDDYSVVDIKSPSGVYDLIGTIKPDIVINLAAMVSRVTCEASPSLTMETNVLGAHNVARACVLFGVKMVNFSTSEVYGNISGKLTEHRRDMAPNNIYGLSKLMCERIIEYEVENNGLMAVTIRPFMIYDELETLGAHRSAMIRFAESLIKGESITVHKGATRSWLHISDAVMVIEKIMLIGEYSIYNMGHPYVLDVSDMAGHMCTLLDLSYADVVNESVLPDMMTLHKYPCIEKQVDVMGRVPMVDPFTGIEKVLETVKERVNV